MRRLAVIMGVICGAIVPLFAQYGTELSRIGQGTGGAAPTEKRSLISIRGGYTSAALDDVNDNLGAVAGPGGSVSEMGSGYCLAVDYLYRVAPELYLGPRVEYIGLNRGRAARAGGVTVTQDYYLVPLLLGGRYYLRDRRSSWNVSGAVFAGVGLGYGQTNSTDAPGTSYSGSGFVGDLLIGGEYRLSRTVSIGLEVGYRLADIPSMNTGNNRNGSYAPAVKRADVTNAAGKTVKYDFSGVLADLGINFDF